MHFTKTIVSLFALASFASASAYEEDHADALAARHEEYLEARAAYLDARDEYMLEKRGGFLSKSADGTCKAGATPPSCVSKKLNKRCGICAQGATSGSACKCQY